MDIEEIRKYCLSLPQTLEDIKWGADLCFTIAAKMYCVTGLEGSFGVSFKCTDEDFQQLIERENITPAPYLAKNKWVHVKSPTALSNQEWEHYIATSYKLIVSKLPKKAQKDLGIL
ncbi:hypothetical protein EXU57_02285 [Segetibacter sp. 3557_3]|uniref:MmcQ/YjbR family DNA-binding protein n=1 Tax=Segetibacter sp. 3557_3 TaxID=2547429 RepID=UPI0010585777|nr:MmcQ/YjbR family DNA-binding protein [Segetibacter sp. 3557_3]TDH28922.1 hypothetical protein EXU57_02285 [Segetibacter sp. 3557_3]